MYFDALTLSAVLEELRDELLGGRIQRVVQTGPLSIGLDVYARGRRHHLAASADARHARLHLTRTRPARGVELETPLLLLLRKYVLGGRIAAIEQPAAERVAVFSIVKPLESRKPRAVESADELPDEPDDDDAVLSVAELLRTDLIIEPQDRRSNILLVDDDNRVLDAVKRVTPRMSRRVILPRVVYELPSGGDRRLPLQVSAADFADLQPGADLVKVLTTRFRGVSPQIAREMIFRACGTLTPPTDPELPRYRLAARLRELWAAEPQPSLVRDADGLPAAYAAYLPTHLTAQPESFPSVNALLDAFYTPREAADGRRLRRTDLLARLQTAADRLDRQGEQLAIELERARELDRLRWEGEMIFAFLHELSRGSRELTVEGRTIVLDPQLSPVEQAQRRFKAYEKSRSALAEVPQRVAALALRRAALQQLMTLLAVGDEAALIDQIAAEAVEQGFLPAPSGPRRTAPRSKPLRVIAADGTEIYVGRSAAQNEEVTFRIGRPDDVWLHARGIPGAHVIVRHHAPAQAVLRQAAALAAAYSQQRDEAAVDVDYCPRNRVRRIRQAAPGLVSYHAEGTLRVSPAAGG